MDKDAMDRQLNLRVSANDLEALDSLRGVLRRGNAARQAFRLGLLALSRDPSLLTKPLRVTREDTRPDGEADAT